MSRCPFILFFAFLCITLLTESVFAAGQPVVTYTMIVPGTKSGKTAERIFQTVDRHHFNKEAPNKVEFLVQEKWVAAANTQNKGEQFIAKAPVELERCAPVRAALYVCDNANTYCLPRRFQFGCKDGELRSSEWNGEVEAVNAAAGASGSAKEAEDKLFIANDPDAALAQAKKEHKPLLINFYGIWCPPCNQLEETVFNQPDFQAIATNFVLLKLDADSPVSWGLKSRYKVKGYPTVVFASETGGEISRLVGARDKDVFIKEMKTDLKQKDASFEAEKKVADEKNGANAAYKVGLTYLQREEYYPAHFYLWRASRDWTLGDIRRNKLLSAALGVQSYAEKPEDKRAYAKFLLKALEWYPRQIEVFDRAQELGRVADELGDKATADKARSIDIENIQWYLHHPKAMTKTDFSKGDLYETLGGDYEKLGKTGEAQAAYEKAADEYLASIKEAKLDPMAERGYNLERLWCLWKAGQSAESAKLYQHFEELYPNEFTFYYQHGRLLNDDKKYDEAEKKAQTAFDHSYGDNKLRAAALLAEVYLNKKDKKHAQEVLDKTMKGFELPEDTTIRSHRYYNKLAELRKKLQ